MTTKMTRRTFLKGAAAAAAAVSLSGLLTGCGGDQELPDNAVQLGVFNVSIYGLNVDQGAELGGNAGAITGTVKIRFSDSGSSTQAVPYRGMFNATVGSSNLNQVAPTGTLVVSDALLGKPFATKEKDLKLSFPDVATREAYQSGKPAYLTITINNITGVLYLVKRGDGYVATKTVGSSDQEPFAPGTLKRVPGAFCRSAQGQKDGFGQFFRQCKEMCHGFHRQFTSSLQRPGPAPKVLPAFCPRMVAAMAGVRYNKAVPKETQQETPGGCPARSGGKYYEKDHASFVPGCLRHRGSRCCSDRLRRFRFFCYGIHRFFRCREHCCRHPERQCGHRRFHLHEERHRCPDRRLCRG